MRSNERIMEMIEMRNEGKSLAEIGRTFSVSRQRVFQILGKSARGRGRPIKNCVFPGILKWLFEHGASIKEMSNGLGCMGYMTLQLKLSGKHAFTLPEVNAILAYTGMNFEEAFGKDG